MNVGVPIDLIMNLIQPSLEIDLLSLGGFGYAEMLPGAKNILDDTTKIVIYNKNNKRVAFLLCAFSKFSDLPIRNVKKSADIKFNLGKELGSVLLDPINSGENDGIGYVVWPYCRPLESGLFRRKLQLFHLKPIILTWLKSVNESSICRAKDDEVLSYFINPLQRLRENKNISKEVKDEINFQIRSLESHSWSPFFVMAHNDFWLDNILIDENNIENKFHGLTVIDWAGSNYKSFAIYDLVRMAISLRLSRTAFSAELLAHCNILNCNKRNATGYLLASLAFLADNLEQFPEERFNRLLNNCFNYLNL